MSAPAERGGPHPQSKGGFSHVGVIGGGAWGTALAQVCARAGLVVTLWARESEVVAAINRERRNPVFLPDVDLAAGVEATGDMASIASADLILAVAPAQHLRGALDSLAAHAPSAPIVLCAKGIEAGSLKLMTEVLAETLPDAPAAVLSGPSFASEVVRGLPTAVTLASRDLAVAERIAAALATSSFRPYVSDDPVGAEAGGAVKNVLAIAAGIVAGRGLGQSAHAALVTRGFAELTRLAEALGGEAETVAGLCGLGDLILTCSSPTSRNFSLGRALAAGQSAEQALAGRLSVAEGAASAPAAVALAKRHGVEMPICEAVRAILAGETAVDAAIADLLARPLRAET